MDRFSLFGLSRQLGAAQNMEVILTAAEVARDDMYVGRRYVEQRTGQPLQLGRPREGGREVRRRTLRNAAAAAASARTPALGRVRPRGTKTKTQLNSLSLSLSLFLTFILSNLEKYICSRERLRCVAVAAMAVAVIVFPYS